MAGLVPSFEVKLNLREWSSTAVIGGHCLEVLGKPEMWGVCMVDMFKEVLHFVTFNFTNTDMLTVSAVRPHSSQHLGTYFSLVGHPAGLSSCTFILQGHTKPQLHSLTVPLFAG